MEHVFEGQVILGRVGESNLTLVGGPVSYFPVIYEDGRNAEYLKALKKEARKQNENQNLPKPVSLL